MIKIIFCALVSAIILSTQYLHCQIYPDFETVDKISQNKQKLYNLATKNISSDAGNEYDIKYHRLHFFVDPAVRELTGEVTTYFKIIPASTSQISFDFSDTLILDSVIYHYNTASYSRLNDKLTITLPVPLSVNDFDSVSVYYHGVPRFDNMRTFGQALQDTLNNPIPVLWTLSQPYGAKEWWPCKQNLNDKIDSTDILISAPEMYRSASIGLLISEQTNAGVTTAFWKHRYPVTAYLIAFAVTDYSVYSDYVPLESGDSLQVLNYVYPLDSAAFWNDGKCVIDFIQLYDSLFIEYPFVNERYGHAQFSWMGGMEHQTMSFMYNLNYELVSHELAHMWFGDYITCGSWEHIWLNEGFATYLSGLCYEHLQNGVWWPVYKNVIRTKVTEFPDGSVFCTDTTDVSRIFSGRLSYRKGAALLHMLRWEIGDSAFYAAIKNYLNDPLLGYGYAKTNDLVNYLEISADTSLSGFFDDWFYGEGYPVYTVHWNQAADSTAEFNIYQASSHSSVDFFEMHVPLQIWHDNADTILIFRHTINGESFNMTLPFIIDSIVFDPEIWLVTKDPQIIQTVPENPVLEKLMIYPIPAENIIYIQVPEKMNVQNIKVYNISGKEQMISFKQEKNLYIVDLNSVKRGAYFVEIIIPEGIIRKKIIAGK
jgi:aminopeptidase N